MTEFEQIWACREATEVFVALSLFATWVGGITTHLLCTLAERRELRYRRLFDARSRVAPWQRRAARSRHAERASGLFIIAFVLTLLPGVVRAADEPGADSTSALTAASASPAAMRLAPSDSAPDAVAMPTVRRLDVEDRISGSEPDPESFDRRGLETWWQRYERQRQPEE